MDATGMTRDLLLYDVDTQHLPRRPLHSPCSQPYAITVRSRTSVAANTIPTAHPVPRFVATNHPAATVTTLLTTCSASRDVA